MIVHQITTLDEGITNPKRRPFGITLAIRWGDVLHPLGPGNWFSAPYFTRMLRFRLPELVPFAVLALWIYALDVAILAYGWYGLLALPAVVLNPGLFVAWNLWGWRGYLGAKVWGAEPSDTPGAPGIEHWLDAADIAIGSTAIQWSGRLMISD